MAEHMDFQTHSKVIAEKFLQTVVAVDDDLVFKMRPPEVKPEEITDNFDGDDKEGSGLGSAEQAQESTESNDGDGEHPLYYQELSVAFSNKGIVCSGIKPYGTLEESVGSVFESSKNSDITILDWQMDKEWDDPDGSLAIASIKKILERDILEDGRLRLIVIYTAMPDLTDIAQQVCGELPEEYKCSQVAETLSFNDDVGKLRHCLIKVMKKQVTETDLSERAVEAFSDLTSGLLSNAALASISDLREKTHNILHRFNKTLDPAYLSHVFGLMSSPSMREQAHDVAFDYAADLISEELKSGIQVCTGLKESLGRDVLNHWAEFSSEGQGGKFFKLKLEDDEPTSFGADVMKKILSVDSSDALTDIVVNHVGIEEKDGVSAIERFEREPIQVSLGEVSSRPHEELSAIESFRRDLMSLRGHVPSLKQGSIIEASGNYYVCLQPLCESVRLRGNNSFVFLKMTKPQADKPFSHVVRINDGSFVRLRLRCSANNLCSFSFRADSQSRTIKAVQEGSDFVFQARSDGPKFKWIAELKHGVAQSISNDFATQLSRVGLDSFEWLRQKSS